MYTKYRCSFCDIAKNVLRNENLAFKEINVEEHGVPVETVIEKTGGRTFPQIIINDKPIGGCDDLLELLRSGELKKMLEA